MSMIFGERVRERCCRVRAKEKEKKEQREMNQEVSDAAKEKTREMDFGVGHV